MKLSWQWLQEFVDLPKVDPVLVGDKLTLHTAELEEVIERTVVFEKVILGELKSIAPHPDSDKLSLAQFDLGKIGKKQIIFGQVHQVAIGEILPIATAGAELASGINIENTEIRGQKSEGMIADNLELGLKQEGLLRFTDKALIGKALPEVIGALGDTLFDIDNKSLTHRPDLVGHRGFARELSAIFDTKLILPEPVISIPNLKNGLAVDIKTPACPRFCALKIEGVRVEPSDHETQMRLENLDVRAISNLVDITNWIMLEYGQPMHVFDADKIEGDLIIRQAKKGEKLVALDGEEYELTTDDTVVADQKKALSIAGIMGGLDSSVTDSTTNIVFEVANWDPVAIRKTSQRLGLRSESSMRYEKSLDPEPCKKALLAATEKALKVCPGAKISSQIVDEYPAPIAPTTIELSFEKVKTLSGIDLDWKMAEKLLKHLGFVPQKNGDKVSVKVPSWRNTKDVSIAEDMVEEIVRLHGLDQIPTKLPSFPVEPPRPNFLRRLQWQVRDNLASLGYLETYLHSFLASHLVDQVETAKHTEVANPLSEEYRYLRRDLWPQMVGKLESELRQHRQVQFFELGKVYHPAKGQVLPAEFERMLMVRASLETNENDDFFAVKADLETLLQGLGLDCALVPAEKMPPELHPSKSVLLKLEGKCVGSLGVLHPRYLPTKGASVVVAELDLAMILAAYQSKTPIHQAPSAFPRVNRDISLIVPDRTFAGDICATAQEASSLLYQIQLFDEYVDAEKLGKNVKNLAFHLQFQASDRTLTEGEIEIEFERIVAALTKAHQATLRMTFDNA